MSVVAASASRHGSAAAREAQAAAQAAAADQAMVDTMAEALIAEPDLMRVPLCVLAGDMVEKYGVSRLTAYRAIAQARLML